jgi:hypothetical protein
MGEFYFNKITLVELQNYYQVAFVFNVSKKDLKTFEVVQNKLVHEDFGESEESVDIFIDTLEGNLINLRDLLDMEKCFVPITDTGGGVYALSTICEKLDDLSVEYKGVLVVVRTISSIIFDKNKSSINIVYYNICNETTSSWLTKNSNISLAGLLAKNSVKLTDNYINEIKAFLLDCFTKNNISQYRYSKYLSTLGGE